jgi:hypothetical protein
MEKAISEDVDGFLSKLARQIELTKSGFAVDLKSSNSKEDAKSIAEGARKELCQVLEVCKDLNIRGRYNVLGVEKKESDSDPTKTHLVTCRLDEPEIDWEELGKKTRNATRRVERSYFYVGDDLASKLKKSDVIYIDGIIDVLPADEVDRKDESLPYLFVVSLDNDILLGRLSDAGAKSKRIGIALLENYSVSMETPDEKRQRIRKKQEAQQNGNKSKNQFDPDQFGELVEELYQEFQNELADAPTSAKRADITKAADLSLGRYLGSCRGQAYTLSLIVQDVQKIDAGYQAVCEIDLGKNDDVLPAENQILTRRRKVVNVSVKDTVARTLKPDDILVVDGLIDALNNFGINIDNAESNGRAIPIFTVGRNNVYLSVRNVVLQSDN